MKHNSPPSLRARETATCGLRRIARELAADALVLSAPPWREASEDIHAIRVASKRLRALLLLMRSVVGEKSYERENARLRNAARRLAGTRDLAVARATLLALAQSADGRRERDAFARVLRGIHRAVAPLDTHGRRGALREVAAALRLSARNIVRLRLPADEWKAIGSGVEAVYRAGRKRMKRAFSENDDAAFHRWRVRVKSLFYQLEMLAPAWPTRLRKTLARLRKLQDKLGDDHDLAVLKFVLEETPDAFGGTCAIQRVISCMDRRSGKLRKLSRKLGRSVYRKKPRSFIRQFEKHWRKWRATGRQSSPGF